MNLHLDKNNFEGAVVAAADYFGIPEIFIENDLAEEPNRHPHADVIITLDGE
jgi:hypothetical protein